MIDPHFPAGLVARAVPGQAFVMLNMHRCFFKLRILTTGSRSLSDASATLFSSIHFSEGPPAALCPVLCFLRSTPANQEIWRSYASLADAESRRAFFRSLRGVIDLSGQAVTWPAVPGSTVADIDRVGRARRWYLLFKPFLGRKQCPTKNEVPCFSACVRRARPARSWKTVRMMRSIRIRERAMRLPPSFARARAGAVRRAWVAGALLAACVSLTAQPSIAYDVMLRWTVPGNVNGYRVYAGARSGTYDQRTDVGVLPSSTLNGVVYYLYRGLSLGAPAYLAVTDYNAAGVESAYSNEKLLNYSAVTAPQVDAGPDQTGPVGASLTIGSKAQDGVSYFWQQTDGPPATLSSRTSSSTVFRATSAGNFFFALTAYNAQGVAARDVVQVTLTGSGIPSPTPTAIGGIPSPTPTAIAASAFIRGNRRRPTTDRGGCQVEWLVADASSDMDRFGLPSQKQTCQDGDGSCDFKPDTSGICEFHVRVCLNNADPSLPVCEPNGIAGVTVLAPRLRQAITRDSGAILAADLDALQNALGHLQDPGAPAAGYSFGPPLEPTQQGFCSAPFAIEALVSNRSTRSSVTLKTRSSDNGFPRKHLSVSQLQLTCLPQAQ